MNRKIIIVLFTLIVVLVGLFFVYGLSSDIPDRNYVGNSKEECSRISVTCINGYQRFDDEAGCGCEPKNQNPGVTTLAPSVQEYFNEKLREGVLDRVGQPIEGFIPQMFMQAFYGIVPKDFDGADAQLGSYTFTDKELVFIVDNVNPIHSAADVLTEEGMKTVLANIQRRADTSITTTDEIDGLLLFLGAPFDPKVTECLPEQRDVDACIEIFQPVCATVIVQCVTAPCDPVLETFGNSCKACRNSLVSSYAEGECSIER